MMLRPLPSDHPSAENRPGTGGYAPRLNLLLSCARWKHDPAIEQLPHVLAPLGINSIKAASGEEAAEVINTFRVHIAVVDLAMPLLRNPPAAASADVEPQGGARILQILRRLDQPPPTVVVRPAQPALRESARGLTQALREGAFAVLDRPLHLEAMLEVLRRIVHRHYADCWPR